MNGIITHPAKVTKVTGATVVVKILAESACASRPVRNKCGMAACREKLLVVETPEASFFEEGEAVEVHTDQVMGLKAVFFAYMLPFLLVLTALLILLQTGSREVVAGTVSLCILGIYYLVLYLFRSKLSKEIVFKIKKLNT